MILNAEPVEVQLQDLLQTPMRHRRALRRAGGAEVAHEAFAEQQIRILDLHACIAATHLWTPEVVFGLRLHDPVGIVDGEYTVRLGAASTSTDGLDTGLPVVEASVNAFSRLWMGERPASSLALTDDLSAPADLVAGLDRSLCLPRASAGWTF